MRFGMCKVVAMLVIGRVEMDMARGHDELDRQRKKREARSPSLAQPEPAHRLIPGQASPAARR